MSDTHETVVQFGGHDPACIYRDATVPRALIDMLRAAAAILRVDGHDGYALAVDEVIAAWDANDATEVVIP